MAASQIGNFLKKNYDFNRDRDRIAERYQTVLERSRDQYGRKECFLARAEHYVGTQGGGMDQASSLMGQTGCALKIDFNPLRVCPISMPGGYRIVVANSLIQAAKTRGALDQYNRRAVECRLAAADLRRRFSDHFGRNLSIELLGDLNAEKLKTSEGKITELAGSFIRSSSYSLKEIIDLLKMTPQQEAQTFC